MSTKYFCDLCNWETRLLKELKEVNADVKGHGLTFHACPKCHKKMFKPVKEYNYTLKIAVEY